MTVLTLAGKAIDWSHPPKPTDRVMWSHRTSGGKKVTGSFRSICHLEHMSILAKAKFGQGVVVIQSAYNSGVRASAGTHDYDACFDVWIPGVAWSEQQSFFRANGAGAYWRRPPAFGNHIHYFCLPPREGVSIADDYAVHGFTVGKYVDGGISTSGRKYTSAQIEDYYAHRTALAGHARDYSWFPANIGATVFDFPAFIKRMAPAVSKPAPKPNPDSVEFEDPMPGVSSRLHLGPHGMSQWLGDSRESVRQASRMAVGSDGGRYVDNNVQACLDDDVVAHSATMRELGFLYLNPLRGPKVVRIKMNARLLDRPLTQWKMADVRRVRRTRVYGTAWESRVSLESVRDRMTYAKSLGVVPYFELKTPLYGLPNHRERIARMVDHAKQIDLPAYFMALDTMRNARGKAENVHAAGGQFALLGHKKAMPSDFGQWVGKVSRVYGKTWLGK